MKYFWANVEQQQCGVTLYRLRDRSCFSCCFLDFQQKLDTEYGETSFTTGPELSPEQNLDIWCRSKSLGMKRDLPLLSSSAFSTVWIHLTHVCNVNLDS